MGGTESPFFSANQRDKTPRTCIKEDNSLNNDFREHGTAPWRSGSKRSAPGRRFVCMSFTELETIFFVRGREMRSQSAAVRPTAALGLSTALEIALFWCPTHSRSSGV